MSVPKSPILKCNKGFLANTEVGIDSPSQSQTSNVNVIVNTDKSDLSRSNTNDIFYPSTQPIVTRDISPTPITNPYNDISRNYDLQNEGQTPNVTERSIDTADIQLQELQSLIKNKDSLIEALNLLLDIYENNPLIVNKFVIADNKSLRKVIKLLTDADKVELVTVDPEVGCGCKISHLIISKILIHKSNDIYNLKYNYPDVIEFFDKHHISYKLVV